MRDFFSECISDVYKLTLHFKVLLFTIKFRNKFVTFTEKIRQNENKAKFWGADSFDSELVKLSEYFSWTVETFQTILFFLFCIGLVELV